MSWHELDGYEVLFYGKDILVVAKHHKVNQCIVTFTSRAADQFLPHAPFGSGVLDGAKTSFVSVISYSNHWWQTEEFAPAMERIASYVKAKRYRKLTGYGGSMGGVGVVHSSQYIKYQKAIVFAAQYDISPDVVPWDKRWQDDAVRGGYSLKAGADKASTKTKFVFLYDPFNLDKRHVELFAQRLRIVPIPVPFAGHELFRTLKEINLAGDTMRSLLLSRQSPEAAAKSIQKQFREKRTGSNTFWINAHVEARRRNKPWLSQRATQELTRIGVNNVAALHVLGQSHLEEIKDPVAAEQFYDMAIALAPEHPAAWRGKTKCRQARQDYDAALEAALGALARRPDSADLCRVLMEASFRAGNMAMLTLASRWYIEKFPKESNSDFFKKFTAKVTDDITQVKADHLTKWQNLLRLISTRKPKRYTALFHAIAARSPNTIMEIGVFEGGNALQMIQSARLLDMADEQDKKYIGFDLFEDMTSDMVQEELSKMPLSQSEIQSKLENTGFAISLIKGYSQETLPKFAKTWDPDQTALDFVFIDGGHKAETIAEDWKNIEPCLGPDSVVFFDDYYIDRPADIDQFGCNELIDKLAQDPKYTIDIMPIVDKFEKDFGMLKISVVKLRLAK